MPNRTSNPAGFTLVELLVVLMIVAVLTAIAYPGYARHVERARRSAARAVLLEAAQFMERYYSARNSYVLDPTQTPLQAPTLPDALQFAPAGAGRAQASHAVTVDSVSATEYKLKAVPLLGDPCGDLTLDSRGLRDRSATGLTVEACWR